MKQMSLACVVCKLRAKAEGVAEHEASNTTKFNHMALLGHTKLVLALL
jgi:hypothetical protein